MKNILKITYKKSKNYSSFLLLLLTFFIIQGCKEPFGLQDKLTMYLVSQPKERVIANWDVVPYQLFNTPMKVGVVAFHEIGVDVEFKVNGVIKEIVTKPTYNDDSRLSRSGYPHIYEFWTQINPADYPDGLITISATAYPNTKGNKNYLPKVLPDLILYANSNGSLTNTSTKWVGITGASDSNAGTEGSPYATIEKAFKEVGAGGTVYIKENGTYQTCNTYGVGENYTNEKRWTTITRGGGTTRAGVIIETDRNGSNYAPFRQTFVRYNDVTLQYDHDSSAPEGRHYLIYTESFYYTWFDNVDIYSVIQGGIYNGTVINDQGSKHYMTNCDIRNFYNIFSWFMRNCYIENVGSDVWRTRNDLLAVNVNIASIDRNDGAHTDVVQTYLPGRVVDNIIFYNIKVENMNSQGIHTKIAEGSTYNIAFVNMLYEKTIKVPADNDTRSSLVDIHHMLMWHNTFHNFNVEIPTIRNPALCSQWNIQNNIFYSFYEIPNPSSTVFWDNSIARYNVYRKLGWTQANGPIGLIDNYHAAYVPGGPQVEYDPLLVNDAPYGVGSHAPGTYDYHPSGSSPIRAAGVPHECVPADIEGTLYNTATPSIGAYQYH